MHKYLKKTAIILGWIIGVIILLLIILNIAIRLPVVQNYIVGKAVSILSKQTGAAIKLNRIVISFPKTVVVNGLYVEDQQNDTLAYIGELKINAGLYGLLRKKIHISQVDLTGTTVNIYRPPGDSAFNYSFIADSLTSAPPDTITAKKDSKPWELSIGHLHFENIRMAYLDSLSGMDITTRLGNFQMNLDHFNLDSLAFGIKEITLSSTDAKISMYGNNTASGENSGGPLPSIDINKIHLSDVNFIMNDENSHTNLKVNTSDLDIRINEFDLVKQKIRVDKFSYQDSKIAFAQYAPGSSGSSSHTTDTTITGKSSPWQLGINSLSLNNLSLSYNNTAFADSIKGFDPNHLDFTGINLQADNLVYRETEMNAGIRHLSFAETHGFKLADLSGNLVLNDTSAAADDLVIQTSGTKISQSARFTFPSLSGISDNLKRISTRLKTQISKLDPADIAYFVPGVLDSLPFDPGLLQPFSLTTSVEGYLNDLNISSFSMNLLDSTSLSFNGSVQGLPQTDSIYMDFASLDFRTSRADLEVMQVDSLVPSGIRIPENIHFTASLNGSTEDFKTKALLMTTFGKIKIDGQMAALNSDQPEYDLHINIPGFETGRLLNDTGSFGMLSANVLVQGRGFDPLKMHSDVKIDINTLDYNNYKYNNVLLDAKADSGTFHLNAKAKDQYVDLDMEGRYTFDTIQPKLNLLLNLNGINLQKLGFSSEDIRAKGKLTAKLSGNSSSNLNGKIDTRDILIIKNNELYPVDSLIFVSFNDSTHSEITLQSDFLSGSYKGTLKPDALQNAILVYLNHYFQTGSKPDYTPNNKNFEFSFNIKSSALLTQVLIPGLEKLDPGTISGSFSEADQTISVQAHLPMVGYRGNQLKDMNFDFSSDAEKLSALLKIDNIEIADYYLSGLEFNSDLSNNVVNGSLAIQQNAGQPAYQIPFQLRKSDSLYLLSFPGDNIVINSKKWKFESRDEIRLSDLASGHYNLTLKNEDESVSFSGKGNRFSAQLSNFRMSNLGNILHSVSGDLLLQGIADGTFTISKSASLDTLNAGFTIKGMKILENPLGKVNIDLQKKQPGLMNGKLVVSENNDLVFDLNKIPLDTNHKADIKLHFNRFNLSTLNGMLPEKSDSLSGWIGGEIDIGNSLDQPVLKGNLTFNRVSTELKTYGTFFNIDGQRITIEKNNIVFPGFTIKDHKGGSLILNGKIQSMLKKPIMDLKVDASNFTAVDKPKGMQDEYFGQLVFSTSTKIQGPTNDLKVKSGLTINDATDFTVSLQSAQPTSTSYTGVVEFVDKDRSLNPILIDSTGQSLRFNRQGFNISANIEIEKNASLAMILDERAGDKLWVQGSANLTFNMDDTGIPSLSGRYNLDDGGYKLTLFDITQREFHLQNGSYILWTGEPMEAQIHIDASYEVETAPYNLIIDQTSNVPGEDMKQYNRKLPFTVTLMIRGEIEAPEISFRIALPPDKRNIYNGVVQSKLNELEAPGNESNLNKQVLSLLAFKQFMPQNPLDIGGQGGGLEATARSSVSRLLSNQLNNFSEKYIKGVSVNFDLQSYEQYSESGGVDQRTELGIGLSKSFFNNRLDVSVGSNVELESEKYRKQNSFNDIAEDIDVEYKLTENGVYRLKAFRYNQYEQFEGDITQSGLSFIFNKDFDYLKYLFMRSDSTAKKNKKGKENAGKD